MLLRAICTSRPWLDPDSTLPDVRPSPAAKTAVYRAGAASEHRLMPSAASRGGVLQDAAARWPYPPFRLAVTRRRSWLSPPYEDAMGAPFWTRYARPPADTRPCPTGVCGSDAQREA